MRYALIIAGGSGTRLWPMSTRDQPKQLIPFIDGKSLLQLAMDRLAGFIPDDNIYVCAAVDMRDAVLAGLPRLTPQRFIGEPVGRDTLNAVTLGTALLGRGDPEAVVAVFTADHIIEPVEGFQQVVEHGYVQAERSDTLVTFGVTPTYAATGYGYLQLGQSRAAGAYVVDRFKEKPGRSVAQQYFDAGPSHYLWNSGMFVWRASAFANCVAKYAPENHAAISQVVATWDSPQREQVLAQVYPTLKRISVDFAVMEPASQDSAVEVAAVAMPLRWLDVGSWTSFAQTRDPDPDGNVTSGCKSIFLETRNTLAASQDPAHLIATIGCDDLIIVHTDKATLVCKANQAEKIRQLHALVGEKFGPQMQ